MNDRLQFSPKQYFFIIASIILSFISLYYAKGFLIPFAFSILFSFILMKPVRWLEKKRIPSAIAIVLVFIASIALVFAITYFFSSQIADLITDFNNFKEDFGGLLDSAIEKYNKTFDFLPPIDQEFVQEKVTTYLKDSGGSILSTTFSQTSSILANLFLIPVYVFLLLLYRKGIKEGITYFFHADKRPLVKTILNDVQSVGKDYIVGLGSVMLILAIVNSVMLLIVGIDYAIMFGCLAALLIIFPYIGTYLGAALPILYALVTMDATHAFIILVSFILIQAIEGNILTPKIVGSNTSVNPLTAFMVIIIGGFIWGISGMILAIPFTAMLKKIFRHVAGLQPLALLMGEELYEKDINLPEHTQQIETHQKKSRVKKLSFFDKLKIVASNLFFDKKDDDNEPTNLDT